MITELIVGLFMLAGFFHYWSRSTLGFWRDRRVQGPAPKPLTGNIGPFIQKKISFPGLLKLFYDAYTDVPFVGLFIRRKPFLMLKDLDMIKNVLVSEFSKFSDKGVTVFKNAEPLSQHLLNLDYKEWQPLRKKLSPVYTTGKLKEMFDLLLSCADNLQTYMSKLYEENSVIEVRELTARFATDVIATCAFGLEANAMADNNSEFRKMGKMSMGVNVKRLFLHQFKSYLPSVYEFLACFTRDNEVTDFFIKTMKDTMEYRRTNDVVRHDFLQYLMEIKDNPDGLSGIELTDSFLASQLFIFFVASFETSSLAMSHLLYEVAKHQDLQDRLRTEIQKTIEKNDGKLTYDSVRNMKFMDMVLKETLRFYPTIPRLVRCPVVDYEFPGTDLTIPKGTPVIIPVYAIHHDPAVYPDPEVFNPDNFTDEAVRSRHPMSFLSFGQGPRICLGAQFAYKQIKVGIIKILQQYRVDVCEKTDIPYKINPRGFTVAPLNGINLKFSKLQSS